MFLMLNAQMVWWRWLRENKPMYGKQISRGKKSIQCSILLCVVWFLHHFRHQERYSISLLSYFILEQQQNSDNDNIIRHSEDTLKVFICFVQAPVIRFLWIKRSLQDNAPIVMHMYPIWVQMVDITFQIWVISHYHWHEIGG